MKSNAKGNLQHTVYTFIVEAIQEHGMPPTVREIGRAIGVESTSHIDYLLKMLVRQGLIERQNGKSRGIVLTHPTGIPVIGTIAAGAPIEVFDEARQELCETLPVKDEYKGTRAFALLVRGQSMIEDAICDGDYVIIRPQRTCENGDIIVATHLQGGMNGSATLKRFFQEQDQVRLQPANADMNPLLIARSTWDREWEIQGKVIALFRRCSLADVS